MIIKRTRGARTAAVAVLAIAFAVLASGSANGAERGIETGFADPRYQGPERELLFDRSVDANASIARIVVSWAGIARRQPKYPADPDDPAYVFRALDDAVVSAHARGLEVLFTLHAAPAWARGKPIPGEPLPPRMDGFRPGADALGRFARALGVRYSGGFVPSNGSTPAGVPLPRVSLVEPWNEPNLSAFLSPQWINGQPTGVELYRRLLNSVYRGFKSAQPDATIIAGATGPEGSRGPSLRTAPLLFLRKLLCLNGRKRLEPASCPHPAQFDVLSHHPISPSRDPGARDTEVDDVAVSQMKDVRKTLRAAERAGNVLPASKQRREVWASEMWWETNPPTIDLYDAPGERRQARYLAKALKLLWKQRIPVALLFQVRDDAVVQGPPRSGWATGILFSDNEPKHSFSAVRFPFVAERTTRRKVSVWLRAPEAGKLRITATKKKRTRTIARMDVDAGEVVNRKLPLQQSGRLRARIDGEASLGDRVPRHKPRRG